MNDKLYTKKMARRWWVIKNADITYNRRKSTSTRRSIEDKLIEKEMGVTHESSSVS
jgi:hypothetical protein|tara:strand:+ start:339 stop:506 length:168 start_codon:yes stop_codon:yes gene_type:complete